MDLKEFMVSFAAVEKAVGGGFSTISDHSRKVEGRLQLLDDKYEQLRAEINRLKQQPANQRIAVDPDEKEQVRLGSSQSLVKLVPKRKAETDVPIQSPTRLTEQKLQSTIVKKESQRVVNINLIEIPLQTSPVKVGREQPSEKAMEKPSVQPSPTVQTPLPVQPVLSSQIQINPQPQQQPVNQQQEYLRLIEQKIRELEERLDSSDRSSQAFSELTNRKISSLYGDLSNNESLIRKTQTNIDLCNRKLGEAQSELMEYKLKKEAKLQRLLNNTGSQVFERSNSSSGGDEAFRRMVIEKVKQLGKDIADCVKIEDYHAQKEEIGKKLSKLVKDVSDRVTTQAYDNLIFYMERTMKGRDRPHQEGDPAEQTSSMEPIFKMISSTKKEVELLKEQLSEVSDKLPELGRIQREATKKIDETSELATKHSQHFLELEQSLRQVLQNLDKTYERKVGELETIVNEVKEKQDKQQKLYNFRQENTHAGSDVETTSIYTNREDIKKTEVMRSQMQIEIASHSKKLNKIYLSSNQIKNELQRLSEEVRAEIDQLRNEVDKKADHESVKKSFHFVENKLNQIVGVMVQNGHTEADGDSLIAKKHWSCLSCDKNLDKFQGKLGEVRFTSVFPPTRFESPRIGGYFRQNQADKDYKKLFMGFSDNRQRRNANELPQVKTDRP